MTTKKKVTLWMGLHRWKLACGAIIATAAAIAVTAGPLYRWESQKHDADAHQAAQVEENTQAITAITAKLDKIAEDTAEVRGSVDTLLRLMQAGGRDHQAVRVTSSVPPSGAQE